ncbi:hypothetical protein CPB84DRAFT_1843849 [Gymnopilus junonius]|uniref:Protein kinase domain-containing protein n=1 Tax=Gymnopilus junonius TaxID=109634 RepID=A0A9P5TRK1_GYMJU|nr:hypothetical protein CPB84DRAFT_1843849 [Gymnopilus junonius]
MADLALGYTIGCYAWDLPSFTTESWLKVKPILPELPSKALYRLGRPGVRSLAEEDQLAKLTKKSLFPGSIGIVNTIDQTFATKSNTAVIHDSTFFIFNCGRYERIGFRHRGSKTLYLSGVIDMINITDPSYRQLHVGLHTAILQDALERSDLKETSLKLSLKRTADFLNKELPSKRLKSSPVSDTSEIFSEIAKRKLAVVKLHYGVFCSPVPSSFVRVGPSCAPGAVRVQKEYPKQTKYKTHEYFTLTLKESLGEGAVGVVHPAALEFTTESDDVLTRNLVIKLAFSSEQQKRMLNEYRIYGHLCLKKGIEGIITVHSMFRDPDSGTLGMLMDDAGQSLRHREQKRSGYLARISTTEKERNSYIRALKSLHEAGVRHNDIRAEILLVNSRNEVFIVDFDRATIEYNELTNRFELQAMIDILRR